MRLTVLTFKFGTRCLVITSLFFMFLCVTTNGQTQKPSVQTGVTFQWEDVQVTNNNSATLSSITIDGEVFQSIVTPSSYAMTRLGPDGHNKNKIIRNGTTVNNNSSNINWNADALANFQDKNLNHYFVSTFNGRDICESFSSIASTDAQIQSLYYNPGIPSNEGGVIAITERNANNCFYISFYGTPVGGGPETFLGDTFVRGDTTQTGPLFNSPPEDSDYWNSGRVVDNGGTIGIAIFDLKDLAPVGSIITRVDLTAATVDHGDGKIFIMQRYAKPIEESGCFNNVFYGTVNGPNIPTGSTFFLVSEPSPTGQAFTFNPDGTYEYTPSVAYTGDVTFEYGVCLPFPNITTCDEATVTITLESGPGTGCECNSGNADAPGLND